MAARNDTPLAPSGATARRALLGGAAVLGAATAGVSSCRPVSAAAGADAELIALCADYVEAVTAYDEFGGYLECEDDPLWHAIEALQLRLNGLAARTPAGLVAKARVAQHLARQPDGSLKYSDAFTADWPEQVVRDLLRLHGEA